MTITRKRAEKCTTHHHCDCMEYRLQEAEQTLRVIHTWALFDKEGKWPDQPALKPEYVIKLCDKALSIMTRSEVVWNGKALK